jgi:UDP-GlcNAc:undecaprenyl-phosphate GlcNAc-1-phosphate transferase
MIIIDSIREAFQSAGRNELILLAIAFAGSFLVCLLLIPVIIRLSTRFNLLDKPNERKVHKNPISRLGGLGIVAGTLSTAGLWFIYGNSSILIHLLMAVAILLVIGITDDIRELTPKIKFIGQIMAALLLAKAGLRIDSLFGLFGITELHVVVQYFITVFIVVGIINAINLIDGIDGLAGGLTLIDMTGFLLIFLISRELSFLFIATSVAGALLAFLRYNWHPAKIFMGDTGSMVLGLLLGAAGIQVMVISRSPEPAFAAGEAVIFVFSVFLLPVYDTIRVFSGRLLNRKSPFSADKTHVHHLLMKTGFNHPKSARLLYTANIVIIGTGFLFRSQSLALVAPLLVLEAIFFLEFLTLYKLVRSRIKDRHLKNQALRMKVDNRLLLDNIEENDGKKK